jgi:hypothetical protein
VATLRAPPPLDDRMKNKKGEQKSKQQKTKLLDFSKKTQK